MANCWIIQRKRPAWSGFFQNNPATLQLPTDIAGTKNVRELLVHIVAVQVRYAERLLNLPVSEYAVYDLQERSRIVCCRPEER